MANTITEAAENIMDKEFKVLDHGFVRLISYMGGDQRVVDSARVSYQNGTKKITEDKNLIDYLMRNGHMSPFEQTVITFHMKMPVFVARQLIRTRTARVSEMSGRYSILPDEAYVPGSERYIKQNKKKSSKQGGDHLDGPTSRVSKEILEDGQKAAFDFYDDLLEMGLVREIARINLPLSVYTQWYFQLDLNNLFKLLKQRDHLHAQWETRQFAIQMAEITKKVAPLAYEAYEKHMKYSVNISGEEIVLIEKLMRHVDYESNLNQETSGEILDERNMRILKDKLTDISSQMQFKTDNVYLQHELNI